jgi:hypothetical protein
MDLTTREPQVMLGRTVKIATVAFAIAVGGTLQMILTVIVAALVLREHRWSLTAATLLGFGGVILFRSGAPVAALGPFSDSFISAPGVT